MPKYHIHDNENDSGYESEEESTYTVDKKSISGTFARARKLHSSKKIKMVLDPLYFDEEEVNSKYEFFKTLYPKEEVVLTHLNKNLEDYRLILPFIAGHTYKECLNLKENDQVKLFLSAVKAIKQCHNQGLVIIDLNSTNILFEPDSGKSYLIDGGFSRKIGYQLPVHLRVSHSYKIKDSQKEHPHIAPECWYINKKTADARMDIYSLGAMMAGLFSGNSPPIMEILIRLCTEKMYTQRPRLDDIETVLSNKTLQNLIVTLNKECIALALNYDKNKKTCVECYQNILLLLILKGKSEFKHDYHNMAKVASDYIDDKTFTEYTQAVFKRVMALSGLNNDKFDSGKANFLMFQRAEKKHINNQDLFINYL